MAVDNDTSGWKELDVTGLQSGDGSPVPIRLLVNRFKSSSPDAEEFIHDPLQALIDAEGRDEIKGFGFDKSWRVTTHIVNHHVPLRPTHLYANVTVATDEQTAGVTMVKKVNA